MTGYARFPQDLTGTGAGLSDPEDVEDDQGLRFVVHTERQDAVLTELGLAELRLTAARLYLPGVPGLVDQPR